MASQDHDDVEYISLDQPISSISRYYIGGLVFIVSIALLIYCAMYAVLERHSVQQNISFLVSSQFIKFQQLANSARALMRASADPTISENAVDRLVDEVKRKIIEIRNINSSLGELRQKIGATGDEELNRGLEIFLRRAEILVKIDNETRRRRFTYLGSIDFAAASGSSMMRGFQTELQNAAFSSEESIKVAKQVSVILTMLLVLTVFVIGFIGLHPLLKKLRISYERNKIFEKKLSELAHTDGLTHLPNRMAFMKKLEKLMSASNATDEGGIPEAALLLLFDLDNFKSINDTYGHPAGNELLIEVATRIQSAAQGDYIPARLGGDEFALLAPGVGDAASAQNLAEEIRMKMLQPFHVDGNTIMTSVSIGGAIFPIHAKDAPNIIKCADIALYASKVKRNSFSLFDASLVTDRRLKDVSMNDLPTTVGRG